jgi:hypothetical protein
MDRGFYAFKNIEHRQFYAFKMVRIYAFKVDVFNPKLARAHLHSPLLSKIQSKPIVIASNP